MDKLGKFIVFEGLDGCGKTTHQLHAKQQLDEMGIPAITRREPTDGIIGQLARDALSKQVKLTPVTLAHIFAADRIEHVNNVILPELSRGVSCLCDRHFFSNLAYQGLSMPMEHVLMFNSASTSLVIPDLTLFIDVPPDICLRRIHNGRKNIDLYEEEDVLHAARDNYFKAFDMVKEARVVIINGEGCPDEIYERVWKEVKQLFV